jgi:molybdate transport system substrate-binding protein
MTKSSLVLWAGLTAVLGLVFSGDIAQAAELKVLASVALTSALDELAPVYEKETGDKLSIGYSLAADLKKRILDGETADVIILTRPTFRSKINLRPTALWTWPAPRFR